MNAIVGLVERKDSLDNALLELRQAGCSAQRTRPPAPPTIVSEHVASSRRRSSPRATAFGASLGGIAYAVIGIAAAHCAANGGIPALWTAGTAVVFTLLGLGLGACGGAFLGRIEAEQTCCGHSRNGENP
jgi:hypothetical protein